jgi:MFS family permease
VGLAADRLGRAVVLAVGGVVLLVALVLCALAPEGESAHIVGGLFLLGLGWSLATVAASTIVAEQAPLEALPEVQGTADLVMSLAAAAGGAFSGVIVGGFGFPVLAGFASIFAVVVLVASVVAGRGVAVRA